MHDESEIISVGTTRALRVKRVGRVYFVEQMKYDRHLEYDDGGGSKEIVEEVWSVAAVAKGDTARAEAIDWLNRANADVIELMIRDRQNERSESRLTAAE